MNLVLRVQVPCESLFGVASWRAPAIDGLNVLLCSIPVFSMYRKKGGRDFKVSIRAYQQTKQPNNKRKKAQKTYLRHQWQSYFV